LTKNLPDVVVTLWGPPSRGLWLPAKQSRIEIRNPAYDRIICRDNPCGYPGKHGNLPPTKKSGHPDEAVEKFKVGNITSHDNIMVQ